MKMVHAAFGVAALWLWEQALLWLVRDNLTDFSFDEALVVTASTAAAVLATVIAIWPVVRLIPRLVARYEENRR